MSRNLIRISMFWLAVTASAVNATIGDGDGQLPGTIINVDAATAQAPLTLSFLPADPKDPNFTIKATGFSVSSAPNAYRVYSTAGFQQWKWTVNHTSIRDLYLSTAPWPILNTLSNRDDCAHTKDPRLWDPRCGDSLGYFWKNITCPTGGVACQDNDRWNASPGAFNITSVETPFVWPNGPGQEFGTNGYSPIINASKINSVALQPAEPGCTAGAADQIWVDDALPAGSDTSGGVGDTWSWITFSPTPFRGGYSHVSENRAGLHQHLFKNTPNTLNLKPGDRLMVWVWLDPVTPPREIMLQWNDGTWEHRAYWGENLIQLGTDGTNSRRFVGALPPTGQWVRLSVAAGQLGLENRSVNGMIFTLYDGRAAWDYAGKLVTNVVTGPCPPKTGNPCSAYNPLDFATGAANSKVVQVRYADNTSRWFMAFNKMIHVRSRTDPFGNAEGPSQYGTGPIDTWQILWATSPDGANWTVHPQVLFRSTREATISGDSCGIGGLLVTDMIIDNGFYYMVFQDLLKGWSYLARAPIDFDKASPTGYLPSWQVAANPLTASGEYTWKTLPLGQRIDFAALDTFKVMKTLTNFEGDTGVKQASIARVFSSAAPGSSSRYIGITNDFAPDRVLLWSTSSLSKPFIFESNITLPANVPPPEQNGWEATFVHYPDNNTSTPRILATGFELWFTEKDKGLVRHRAVLSNF